MARVNYLGKTRTNRNRVSDEVRNRYMERKIQLDATKWFIELMIHSTFFGHHYAHHQELETIQMVKAYDTKH